MCSQGTSAALSLTNNLRFPPFLRLTQRVQRAMMGMVHQAATLGHKRMEQFEDRARKYIASVVTDPVLREQVTPKSRYACKRGLVSDDSMQIVGGWVVDEFKKMKAVLNRPEEKEIGLEKKVDFWLVLLFWFLFCSVLK